ncbi:hypothetical protein JYK04_08134 [Streptomyces nojiriensis]|nr:hypothetical protein JYK04_08134 [Streptomyces nojiriensis]
MPAPAVHCRYIGEWAATEHGWGLAVDQAEREALLSYAAGCPNANLTFERARCGCGSHLYPRVNGRSHADRGAMAAAGSRLWTGRSRPRGAVDRGQVRQPSHVAGHCPGRRHPSGFRPLPCHPTLRRRDAGAAACSGVLTRRAADSPGGCCCAGAATGHVPAGSGDTQSQLRPTLVEQVKVKILACAPSARLFPDGAALVGLDRDVGTLGVPLVSSTQPSMSSHREWPSFTHRSSQCASAPSVFGEAEEGHSAALAGAAVPRSAPPTRTAAASAVRSAVVHEAIVLPFPWNS